MSQEIYTYRVLSELISSVVGSDFPVPLSCFELLFFTVRIAENDLCPIALKSYFTSEKFLKDLADCSVECSCETQNALSPSLLLKRTCNAFQLTVEYIDTEDPDSDY